jgi:NADPH:quinone reductase-like Zn-dependent oxidoreductase
LQLAKYFGAEVTAVCGTPRLAMVKALGADKVFDYTHEDFTQSGETYDLIFDILGRGSFSRYKRVLKANGRYLLASFKMRQLFQMLWTSLFSNKKVICALSSEKPEDLRSSNPLLSRGNSNPSLINAIRWNRLPKRIATLKKATRRATLSSPSEKTDSS